MTIEKSTLNPDFYDATQKLSCGQIIVGSDKTMLGAIKRLLNKMSKLGHIK